MANPRVTAIIPAFNEAATVAEVVKEVSANPHVAEVIVVDDGSHDGTANAARCAGARVLTLPKNEGKASAMAHGVRAATHDIIFFADADIHGLTSEKINRIIEPVLSGRCAMYVGIRKRHSHFLNRFLRIAPVLGGERTITKELWNRIPRLYKKGFQIEIAMNYYTKRFGKRMGSRLMPGVRQTIKEKKHGVVRGFFERLKMIADVAAIGIKLYVGEELKRALGVSKG